MYSTMRHIFAFKTFGISNLDMHFCISCTLREFQVSNQSPEVIETCYCVNTVRYKQLFIQQTLNNNILCTKLQTLGGNKTQKYNSAVLTPNSIKNCSGPKCL